MGGASPKTVNFRGANVDPTTADALTELAAVSGSRPNQAPKEGR